MDSAVRSHNDYSVGWVCALAKEQVAAIAMLDDVHPDLSKPHQDQNTYTLGSIKGHNIVIACLPGGEIGTSSAANVVTQMVNTFPSIRFGLMVGIGGGIPSAVKLGDIVVSEPVASYPGVVQWDLGKAEQGGFKRTGSLDRPPRALLTALGKLKADHEMKESKIPEFMDTLAAKWPKLVAKYTWSDRLEDSFRVIHDSGSKKNGWQLFMSTLYAIIGFIGFLLGFSSTRTIGESTAKLPKSFGKPHNINVHYGLIVSGNQVIKNADVRDSINKSFEGHVLCVEMEAAGLMNNFPCLVIRGICDYADERKNKEWQEYTAALAAAFAKELLQYVQVADMDRERPVKAILQQVHHAVRDIEAGVTHIKSAIDKKEDREVLDWLTPLDYGLQHSDYSKKRQSGTGQWLLESDEFQSWLAASKRTLFCPGIPGAGKTILTSAAIDHLSASFSEDTSVGIAYIYCNFRRQDDQDAESLLASVLKQLGASREPLPPSIKALYHKHATKRTRPTFEELAAALTLVLALYSKIFFIVDALDECQPQCLQPFLSKLFDFQKHYDVNLLATSRFISNIVENFQGPRCTVLELCASERDVRTYLEGNLELFPKVVRRAPELKEEILNGISEAVDGMFLLAQIYITSLRDKTTVNEVRKELQVFKMQTRGQGYDHKSKALKRAYEQAMERIHLQPQGLKQLAMRVLSWIAFANRELTISELLHALGIREELSNLDDGDLPDIEDISVVCAGLVTIDEKRRIIRLVHYTTQEFFEDTQDHWFPEANYEIFRACITYLNFDVFEVGFSKTDADFENRQELFPLNNYAASNWGYHMPKGKAPTQDLMKFLATPAKIDASCQAMLAIRQYASHVGYSQAVPREVTGLHLAGHFGASHIASTLLDLGHSPNTEDSLRQTPLFWAARSGHVNVAELLLNGGANVELPDLEHGFTPLMVAIINGNEDMVTLLLERESKVNAMDHSGRTPLSLAATYGQTILLGRLLEKGAIIDANDQAGKIKLASADIDRETLLPLLFQTDDSNTTAATCTTSSDSCELLMQMMLKKGSELSLRDEDGRTLLSRVAENGNERIVKQLITEAQVDVNGKDAKNGETPLIMAAKKGHLAIVNLLLDAGANTEATDIEAEETALTIAIENGHQSVVQSLLERGANIHAKDKCNHTPLFAAAWLGSDVVMQQLLDRGANVNVSNDDGQTPLFHAAGTGRVNMIRLLLDAGAEIDARDESGHTPLFFAASLGQLDAMRFLLGKGANASTLDDQGRTPLFSAIGSGNEAAVELLLDTAMIDVYIRDHNDETPITWAKKQENKRIMQLLLQK